MSKKKKHAHQEEEAGEAWLLPYSDLMTLLLAVFIVLFAVSQVDAEKAKQLAGEFSETMMTEGYYNSTIKNEGAQNPTSSKTEGQQSKDSKSKDKKESKNEDQQMKELKAELDAKLQSDHMTSNVTTKIDKRGLVVSLNNAMFFDPGSAVVKKENEKALLDIAEKVNTMNHFIRIEGHTDNVPMSSELYPSNWDLSTARASNVVRLLISKSHVKPEKLIAVGYGEYRPIADNSTAEGRAKNRRIDIIVLSEKYNDLEKQ